MLFRSRFESEVMLGKRQVVTCFLRTLPAFCILDTFLGFPNLSWFFISCCWDFVPGVRLSFLKIWEGGASLRWLISFLSLLKCSWCYKLRSVTVMGDRSSHPWVRLQQYVFEDLLNVSQFTFTPICTFTANMYLHRQYAPLHANVYLYTPMCTFTRQYVPLHGVMYLYRQYLPLLPICAFTYPSGCYE